MVLAGGGVGRRWLAGALSLDAVEVEHMGSFLPAPVKDRPVSSSGMTEVVVVVSIVVESCPAVADSSDAARSGRFWSTNRAMRRRSASLPFVVAFSASARVLAVTLEMDEVEMVAGSSLLAPLVTEVPAVMAIFFSWWTRRIVEKTNEQEEVDGLWSAS